ncbi:MULTISPECIES: ABC transporter permease [unclassified Beijerinckia]|uniref:ABC transporter permease n=1 Tax=unclassified Beijerinckia TaxID=2638183 RepID=UPI000894DBBD|nr:MULTISPECIES: ABC transporter permease [unclassified Beijerinckia]MDH7799380.1 peptide/nickel transport system permease protein [Beijerinckia sp. GAS462]SED48299.1 peptide/nickel transport system permease protein [Beijerinckia sp. 28-YEA-48]
MSTIVTSTAVGGVAPAGRSDEFDTLAPSPKALMRKRAKGHIGFIIGMTIITVIVLAAIFAPLIAPYDPYAQDLGRRLIDPVWSAKGSWENIFGTDALGRDVLSRLIYGARISLMIGFTAAVIAGIIGTALGILGGYFGGKVDAFVVYLINVKLALPVILVALSVSSISGGSIMALIILLGFLTWDRYAVVTRSMTQQMREREFIMSSKAAGASHNRILWREILPNLMNQVIIIASLDMALIILVEAALSFLGLGIRPPTPSWGLMVSEGRAVMFFKPYLIMVPGAAIFLLVIAINMAGDGIRDITSPEGRG